MAESARISVGSSNCSPLVSPPNLRPVRGWPNTLRADRSGGLTPGAERRGPISAPSYWRTRPLRLRPGRQMDGTMGDSLRAARWRVRASVLWFAAVGRRHTVGMTWLHDGSMVNRNGIPIADRKKVCPKDQYASQSEADGFAVFLRYQGTRERLDSYRCPSCRSWHLTKAPQGSSRP